MKDNFEKACVDAGHFCCGLVCDLAHQLANRGNCGGFGHAVLWFKIKTGQVIDENLDENLPPLSKTGSQVVIITGQGLGEDSQWPEDLS